LVLTGAGVCPGRGMWWGQHILEDEALFIAKRHSGS
jgi:hypothetical protein